MFMSLYGYLTLCTGEADDFYSMSKLRIPETFRNDF